MALMLQRVASLLGPILLVHDGSALRALDFEDRESRMHRLLQQHTPGYTLKPGLVGNIAANVAAYFEGDLDAFASVATQTAGSTFQRRVWAALMHIPAGTTTTYGALASSIGAPGASRAVGLANGANPLGIVVPCHRVIGANATLTGYGGGLERKAWLLRHEATHASRASDLFSIDRARPASLTPR